MKANKTNPHFGDELSVKIIDEHIEGKGEESSFKKDFNTFIYYIEASVAFLLYSQKNLFFMLPKKPLEDEEISIIRNIISCHNIESVVN